jgi:uncharacterized protein (TIGR02145 family)
MMRKLFAILAAVLFTASLFLPQQAGAQAPQKMSYQAVIRNSSNQLVVKKVVRMKISILQGSATGTVVYVETQTPTTNSNGLVSIEFGGGTGFNAINWANGLYFIKTETDPLGGTNYTITGTSQLLSVPFALYAKTAENGFSGDYNDLTNKPSLFDGNYNSLNNKPALFDGNYSSLTNKPSLFDGNYNSLTNKPSLFDGNYNSLTNKPLLFDGNYNNLSNKPSLFDGLWSSLTGKPTFATIATSGSYNDLSNKPDISDSINSKAVLLSGNQTINGNKTFAGTIIGTINANNTVISNVAIPITKKDAVNKTYVDSLIIQVMNSFSRSNETFTSLTTGLLTDNNGNNYGIIKIGSQWWMKGNLLSTRFKDGTSIPLVTNATSWTNLTTPGYCWYNNDSNTYKNTYGALYNWYAVNTGKLCPTGWHVPSDVEWAILINYLGGDTIAGGKMKETGTIHWQSPNTGATNSSEFSALPGGYRYNYGAFNYLGTYSSWWSSTESSVNSSWKRELGYVTKDIKRYSYFKSDGYYIRCLRD